MNLIETRVDKRRTGLRIKQIRNARHITVEEMAEALDQSPQAIYKWQRGDCLPSLDNLVAMSELFDVGIELIIIRNTREEEEIPLPFFVRIGQGV